MSGMILLRGTGAVLAGVTAATAMRYRSIVTRPLPTEKLDIFTTTRQSKSKQERVLIIGAGVVGVSTAYKLAQRGHQVAILEPMPEPGEECSACAAGGMSRQNVVVDNNTWVAVLQCIAPRPIAQYVLGASDDHFKFFQIDWWSTLSDPFFLRWAWTFTQTSFFPEKDYGEKQNNMLRFTDYAVKEMVSMFTNRRDDMSQKAGYNDRGSLAVSYEDLAKASSKPKDKDGKAGNTLEPNRQITSTDEVLRLEPSLRFQAKHPKEAKFEYDAKAASSGRFTKELARRCVNDESLDVTFWYDTKVRGINCVSDGENNSKPRIAEVHTNRGVVNVPADVHVVIAAGAWTPHVLALFDVYGPVYPLKGYSMTVNAKEALKANPQLKPADLPSRIVRDKYVYTTRLGDEIRITSIGEFSEWNTQPTPHVDKNFRNEAIRQFPQLKELIQQAKTYCGHRPYVSDGILLLGAADTHQRLYVSAGPGSNGWKLALGSGEIIARLVSGQTTDQMQEELGFDVTTFSPAGRVLHAPLFAKICRARWNV